MNKITCQLLPPHIKCYDEILFYFRFILTYSSVHGTIAGWICILMNSVFK